MYINILKANNRITELETDQKEWSNKYQDKCLELANLQKSYEEMASDKQNFDEIIANLKAEHAKEIEALKATTVKTEESVNDKAIEKLAAIGIDPVVMPAATVHSELTPTEALNQFNAITDPLQKSEFYQKNRSLIRKASGLE